MQFPGILSWNGQIISKVNDTHFQYQTREQAKFPRILRQNSQNDFDGQWPPFSSQDAYLVQIWWLWFTSNTSYCVDKPNFLEVKMVKMTLTFEINDLHFQYQPRVFPDACFVQIWWLQLKAVMSYHTDKEKLTYIQMDGWMDAQMQATTIPLQTEKARGNN